MYSTHYALLSAAYKGHAEPVSCLIACILLEFFSAKASRGEIAALPPACESIMLCTNTDRDAETKFSYAELIDMVYQWDKGRVLRRPQLSSILIAN